MSTPRWSAGEKAAKFQDYKQSNKTRRPKVLVKWGFADEDAFLKYVGGKLKPHKSTKRSSSVASKASKTIEPLSKAVVGETMEAGEHALDYVIAFDCTGSMRSYIGSVKAKVVELVTDMFKETKDLRINVIAFGDYCDMEGPDKLGRAFQSCGITNDTNKLIKFINTAHNTSGGDNDEFYELVIRKINEETPWRPEAKKAVLLIADATPHYVGKRCEGHGPQSNPIDWEQEALKAKELGIQYDSMQINPSMGWLEKLAKITGGISAKFQKASGTDTIIKAAVYSRSSEKSYNNLVISSAVTADSALLGAVKQFGKL